MRILKFETTRDVMAAVRADRIVAIVKREDQPTQVFDVDKECWLVKESFEDAVLQWQTAVWDETDDSP